MTNPAPEQVLMDQVLALHETGLSMTAAWRRVLDRPKKATTSNAEARQRAFKETRLSPQQVAPVRMSDARSVPGTTVQKIRPTPGVPASTPPAERQPGESPEAFCNRIRQQVADLAKPAGRSPSQSGKATPIDSAAEQESSFAEVGGSAFQEMKRELLADKKVMSAELDRHVERAVDGLGVTAATRTDTLNERVHARMRSLGQFTALRHDTPAALKTIYSEQYRQAMAEEMKR
jgi:hypothetical protein